MRERLESWRCFVRTDTGEGGISTAASTGFFIFLSPSFNYPLPHSHLFSKIKSRVQPNLGSAQASNYFSLHFFFLFCCNDLYDTILHRLHHNRLAHSNIFRSRGSKVYYSFCSIELVAPVPQRFKVLGLFHRCNQWDRC